MTAPTTEERHKMPLLFQWIARACVLFGGLALLLLTLVALANIAARWLHITAPEWILPIQSTLMAWGLLAGFVTCLINGSLIGLNWLSFEHRPKLERRLDGLRYLVCALVFAYITVTAASGWWRLFKTGLPSPDIPDVPVWVLETNILLFFGLAAVAASYKAWTRLFS